MLRNDFVNPFGVKDPKGNLRMMSALLDLAVFPGMQGGPLMHVIAAKAVLFGEILTEEFTSYEGDRSFCFKVCTELTRIPQIYSFIFNILRQHKNSQAL